MAADRQHDRCGCEDRWLNRQGDRSTNNILWFLTRSEILQWWLCPLSSSSPPKVHPEEVIRFFIPHHQCRGNLQWWELRQLAMLFSGNYKMLNSFFSAFCWFLLTRDLQRSRQVPEESLRLLQMARSLRITQSLKTRPINRLQHSEKFTASQHPEPRGS